MIGKLRIILGRMTTKIIVEYSIIAGGIALVIVAVVNSIGSTLNTDFSNVRTGLK